jgi:hypothetical protein
MTIVLPGEAISVADLDSARSQLLNATSLLSNELGANGREASQE